MTETGEYLTLIQCEHVFRNLLVENRAVYVIDDLETKGMIPNDGTWLTRLLVNIQPSIDDATGVLLCWLKKYMRVEPNRTERINMLASVFLSALEISEPEHAICCLLGYAIDRCTVEG